MRFTPAIFALLVFSSLATAAIVSGIVYDSQLEPASDAVVEINTVPVQRMVVQKGFYSFNVPTGNYSLRATSGSNQSVEENVSVREDGEFTIDLILFGLEPIEEINVEEITEQDFPTPIASLPSPALPAQTAENDSAALVLAATALLAFFYLLWFVKLRKPPVQKELPNQNTVKTALRKPVSSQPTVIAQRTFAVTQSQKQILDKLAESGGRMTQKEIRKALLHLSEAAVSMDLTELEEANLVKKIKKGRGNVIKLL